jgi:transcriptional regulator with XRE-family HTH domain
MDQATGRHAFGALLRRWRLHRGASQLALSLDAGVSARHLSWLESGKSTPSRAMVLRLAERLDLPLRERNTLLVAARWPTLRWPPPANCCNACWTPTSPPPRWRWTGTGT